MSSDRVNVHEKVQVEISQNHDIRKEIYARLEKKLGRPVCSFFTSFNQPVQIEDADADIIQSVLGDMDLSNGLAIVINSPGGDGLAAERIVNICRSYSGTGEFWTIVPGKAKSAATMICMGSRSLRRRTF